MSEPCKKDINKYNKYVSDFENKYKPQITDIIIILLLSSGVVYSATKLFRSGELMYLCLFIILLFLTIIFIMKLKYYKKTYYFINKVTTVKYRGYFLNYLNKNKIDGGFTELNVYNFIIEMNNICYCECVLYILFDFNCVKIVNEIKDYLIKYLLNSGLIEDNGSNDLEKLYKLKEDNNERK